MNYFQPYLAAPGELVALLACAVVLFGFASIGVLLTRAEEPGGTEVLGGWGVAAAILVALQWLAPVDLRFYAGMVGAAATIGLVLHRRALSRARWWRPGLLLLPVLVVACGVPLDEWDSFSHWGINAAWLWRYDALPSPSLPASPSSHPDYPYGYPLALYLASLARGAYIENAGAMVNALLMVAAAGSFAFLAAGDDRRLHRRPWYWSAWGVLAVIVLNPGFVRSATLAAYADTAFSAAVFFLCLSLHSLLDSPARRIGNWLSVAAVAMALAAVKESGLVMLGVIAIAVTVVGLRHGTWRPRLAVALPALLPGFLLAIAWQLYVADWLPSSFGVLPFDQWRLDLLPNLLASVAGVVADHGLYYALLLVVLGLGSRGWWLDRHDRDRFNAVAGLVVTGHLLTTLLAYLGSGFTETEIRGAVSFHRYATQPGLLVLGAVAYSLGGWAADRSREPRRPGLLVTLCALIMLAGAPYLHRDRTPEESFFLGLGEELAGDLPEGSTVGLLGWRGEAYGYYLLRYRIFRPGLPDRDIRLERVFQPLAQPGAERRRQLERLAGRRELSHLLIIESRGLQEGRGPDMLLLARRDSGWTITERWRNE